MENVVSLLHNPDDNWVEIYVVDAEVIAQFMRKQDFLIKSVEAFKFQNNNETEQLYRNEGLWELKNSNDHKLCIGDYIENCGWQEVITADIEFRDGSTIYYETGILWITYVNEIETKKIIIDILKSYGYFAAEKIWNFCTQQREKLPISALLGYEPEHITDEELYRLKEIKESIEKEAKKYSQE